MGREEGKALWRDTEIEVRCHLLRYCLTKFEQMASAFADL